MRVYSRELTLQRHYHHYQAVGKVMLLSLPCQRYDHRDLRQLADLTSSIDSALDETIGI